MSQFHWSLATCGLIVSLHALGDVVCIRHNQFTSAIVSLFQSHISVLIKKNLLIGVIRYLDDYTQRNSPSLFLSTIEKKLDRLCDIRGEGSGRTGSQHYPFSCCIYCQYFKRISLTCSWRSQSPGNAQMASNLFKLPFKIIYCSSQDDEHPYTELQSHNSKTKGWQSKR